MDICCGLTKEAVAEMRSASTVTLAFPDGVKIAGIELPNIFEATRAWGFLPDHDLPSGEPCLNSGGKQMRSLTEGGPGAWGIISAFCENCGDNLIIAKIDTL